jgi:predicted Zn-dependent protease
MVLILLAFAQTASAQLGLLKHDKGDKEQEREAKEEKKREKEAKKYANLSEFAQDRYASDPDFHDQVDQAYQDLQGQHAFQAFDINTTDTTQVVVKEGDVIKIRRALYDNPRVLDYVNRVGQSLVPADAQQLYAFKVIQSPVPSAYTLSTGTVYISTGLVSLTDNEAQLAYILSHEVAHVYKDHWKTKVMDALAEEEYNKKQERRHALYGALIGAAAGGIFGGVRGGAERAVEIGAFGAIGGAVLGAALARRMDVDWDFVQENEADDFALKNTLDKNYDIQEVPKLYLALTQAAGVDQRVGLGFLGSRKRVKERLEYAKNVIGTTLKPDYEKKLAAAQLVGTSPDYQLMMAELKRDNGILALYFDMFDMAKKNLTQAVNLRTDDARARYYHGKVLKLVARTDAERELARQELINAIKLDATRHFIPEAQLQRALLLLDKTDSASQAEAVQALKDYITSYEDFRVESWKYGAAVPSNMEILYDYLRLLGEPRWKPPYPAMSGGFSGGAIVATAGGGSATPTVTDEYSSSSKPATGGAKQTLGKVGLKAASTTTTGAVAAGAAGAVTEAVKK